MQDQAHGNVILDLFCGCGGFSRGMIGDENTRFIGVDINDIALLSYEKNIPNATTICTDIKRWDHERDINEIVRSFGRIPLVIGSPPCPPISKANVKRVNAGDISLIKLFLKIVKHVKPKYWVMEEVDTFVNYDILPRKYITIYKALDVGLPHHRSRAFSGYYPRFEKKPFDRIRINGYTWKKLVKTPIAHMRGIGHGMRDYRKTKRQYHELNQFLVKAGVLTTLPRHPFDVQTMKWLMGFPQDYYLAGTPKEQRMQIGNAVSPLISRKIWEGINAGTPVNLSRNENLLRF